MSFSSNKTLYISISILIIYSLPWILLRENSYILIHDNLDSNVVWFKTLIESNMAFASNYETIPMLMDAPRVSLGSEFNLQLLYYYLFEPHMAYIINQILIRIIAFIGMFLLLKRYILNNQEYSLLIALTFAILPFWPSGGLTVAGLPLITYIFLNIRNKNSTYQDWIILIIFPFYSSFILSMMFYISFLGLLWLNDIRKKEFHKNYTIALLIFTIIYIFTNYRLFEAFMFSIDFTSHRIERLNEYQSFTTSVLSSVKHFINGQYHSYSLHLIILILSIFVFIHSKFTKTKNTLFNILILVNVFISIWYGFWKYEGWEDIKNSIHILQTLNLSRYHFLSPLIWYILFALSIKYIIENTNFKYKHLILLSIISMQIIFLFSKSDFIKTYKIEHVTYKEFYAEKLFSDIDSYIHTNKRNYKVVSIGIHPLIARYNGFNTADGYLANYSLDYKHKFRHIIEKELEKNKLLKKSFDNWGNRCYLFSNDVGYNFVRKKNKVYPINLDLNVTALRELEVDYVFSSYNIQNYRDNGFEFIKKFEDQESAWDIYLYKLKDNNEIDRNFH